MKELYADIRKAEKRCKGLNTMIGNLETREAALNDRIDRLESELESGNGDAEDLRSRIADLEEQLQTVASPTGA